MSIFGCSNQSKEEQILEKIALSYYKEFQLDFCCWERYVQRQGGFLHPLIIDIWENTNYNGKKNYVISDHYYGIYDNKFPTRLIKRDNYYIAMHLKNRQTLSKDDIPKSLIRNPDSFGGGAGEGSWVVLICPDTYQYIVVHIGEAVPNECVKQLREFSCDGKKQRFIGKVKVEKWILDRDVPPPPPYSFDTESEQ